MKPRVFIGSSKEGLSVLEKVHSILNDHVDAVTWINPKAFAPNRGILESIVKQTKLSDFAVLIATKDDLLSSRDVIKEVARDNVIFEFGLFLGAAGIDRAFLLAEDKIGLPSDFNGISVLSFVQEDGKFNSLENRCNQILSQIQESTNRSELGFVPSTALAIGYFSSFVRSVCEEVGKKRTIDYNGSKIPVKSFKLNIVLPNDIDEGGVNDFRANYNLSYNLEPASTSVEQGSPGRGYPFHFKIDPPDQDTSQPIDAVLYDVPTTINTIVEAIKLYYPVTTVGVNVDKEHLERRELENFANVLKYLINKNAWTKNNVTVIEKMVL